MVSSEAFVLLRRFLLLFIPINKITAEQKLRFLSKTGVRNEKKRNPEDSGRNMQPRCRQNSLRAHLLVGRYGGGNEVVPADVLHVDHQTGGTLQRNQQTTITLGQVSQEHMPKLSEGRRSNLTYYQMPSRGSANYIQGISKGTQAVVTVRRRIGW